MAQRLAAYAALPYPKVASIVFGLYLFILSSILAQILTIYLGIPFPLVAFMLVVVAIFYFAAGNHARFIRSPFFWPWVLLWVWWTFAAVVGMYPGRSLPYMLTFGLRIHILPFIACAIAVTAPALINVTRGFAAGYLVILFMCFRYGQTRENRFFIPETTLANGNDLALHIVLGLCFVLILIMRGRPFTRFILAGGIPIMVYYVFRTGSRANMLTLALLLGVCFLIMPVRWKIASIITSAAMAVMLFPLLPEGTVNRLFTFTQARTGTFDAMEAELSRQAVDSTNARLMLQKRAIDLSLANPLFGVGPLMFTDAVDSYVRETEGRGSAWQVSHNSYLQVSSETGIPGFLLYVWCIFLCIRTNFRCYREARRMNFHDEMALSAGLLLATITYAFGILFCSIALDYYLAALVSFTSANALAQEDLRHYLQQRPQTV
ncbi:hypothetical protein F183_A54980 (plasmid) [Bryobacterales bacterium F-183]|nr:hypothetical protein F183_A54980 [Bryobacterales bacterium F-183]